MYPTWAQLVSHDFPLVAGFLNGRDSMHVSAIKETTLTWFIVMTWYIESHLHNKMQFVLCDINVKFNWHYYTHMDPMLHCQTLHVPLHSQLLSVTSPCCAVTYVQLFLYLSTNPQIQVAILWSQNMHLNTLDTRNCLLNHEGILHPLLRWYINISTSSSD